MDEDLDPLTVDEAAKPISHRDILLAMAVLIAAVASAGFVLGGVRWGFGIIVGGGLSYLNYLWLDRSTKALFAKRTAGGPPAGVAILALAYILRYAAIGAVLLAIYLTDAFPITAVILGLASFAFAVVFQGVKNIFTS